jgi:hypothetical protein
MIFVPHYLADVIQDRSFSPKSVMIETEHIIPKGADVDCLDARKCQRAQ